MNQFPQEQTKVNENSPFIFSPLPPSPSPPHFNEGQGDGLGTDVQQSPGHSWTSSTKVGVKSLSNPPPQPPKKKKIHPLMLKLRLFLQLHNWYASTVHDVTMQT